MADLRQAALDYASRGWQVFPLKPRSKEPAIPKRDGGRGCLDATTDDQVIEGWWRERGNANIGLHCSRASGCWALDIDADAGGFDSLRLLTEAHGDLPDTLRAATAGGGAHYLFRWPEGRAIKNRVGLRVNGQRLPGIDVRAEGGYIVVAPSVHPNGKRYAWANDARILAPPDWLVDLLDPVGPAPAPQVKPAPKVSVMVETDRERKYCESALHRACNRIAGLLDGRRDAILREAFNVGGFVGAGLIDWPTAYSALVDAGRASGTRHHVERHVAEALTAGALRPRRPVMREQPSHVHNSEMPADWPGPAPSPNGSWTVAYHQTDTGNARRFADMHGVSIRYASASRGSGWLTWAGNRWSADDTGEVYRLARTVPEAIDEDALRMETDAARAEGGDREELMALAEETRKHARRTESRAALQNLVELAKSEPGIAVPFTALDQRHWLLNTPTATIDLTTGLPQRHRREDLLTALAGADHRADADCPTWSAFLDRIFESDAALIAFVQRLVGYSMVGGQQEQVLAVLHGSGANGKSTFVNAIRHVLGDYAKTASADLFVAKREGGIPNELAALRAARFVAASEFSEGKRLDEAFVKQLTGGEPVLARFLNHEFFEFVPLFTVFLSTNHRPIIRGLDHGIWRRLLLIPFAVTIPAAERDPELPRKLEAEADGILRWALDGCLAWQAQGLAPPEAVRAAGEEYRQEQDALAAFLDDCCVIGPGERVANGVLYAAYAEWARVNGEPQWSHRRLTRELRERGYAQTRSESREWQGLRLASQPVRRVDRWEHREH